MAIIRFNSFAGRLSRVAGLVLCCAAAGCDSTRPAREHDDEIIEPIQNESDDGLTEDETEGASDNPFVVADPQLSPAARAVDEIASEIYESLPLKPVLVVWLFDATTSAEALRREVGKRLARDGPMLGERGKSTRWVLTEADTFASDSTLNKLARRARDYLERVASTHSGTPWAWLAGRESQVPMAWNWVEQ